MWLLLFLLLTSCSKCEKNVPPFTKVEISGRDEIAKDGTWVRRNVYQASIPSHWMYESPSSTDSLADSTQANARFTLKENGETLLLTVHTFPCSNLGERIPPQAQVARWQKQSTGQEVKIEPLSRSGFAGYYFESENIIGWAMQMDSDLFQSLHFSAKTPEEKEYASQRGADYTLKAVGPPRLLQKYKNELFSFAKSFELIQDLPPK